MRKSKTFNTEGTGGHRGKKKHFRVNRFNDTVSEKRFNQSAEYLAQSSNLKMIGLAANLLLPFAFKFTAIHPHILGTS